MTADGHTHDISPYMHILTQIYVHTLLEM